MKAISATPLLHRLARLYGLQTAYYDADHCRKPARAESLLAILRSLGAPIENVPDVPQAWHEKRRALWENKLEPVVVAWDNEPSGVRIKLPASTTEGTLNCHIRLESGEERQWQCPVSELDIIEAAEIEGTRYMDRQFPLPGRLPWGYHRLTVELAGECVETLLISAPARAYSPPGEIKNRSWGVFLPLHALHTSRSWGSGDFSDLAALAEWVAKAGGKAVATLPVLPTFQNKTFEISPYLPISRLAYHEFYLDVSRVPELGECPPAQALMASPEFQEELTALRGSPLVNYPGQMALKRRVLEELSRSFFSAPSGRLEDLRRFTETNPVIEDYACFRAALEKQHLPWQDWPLPLREGILRDSDYRQENKHYHLYAQWLAHQQLDGVKEKAEGKGVKLYMDMPMGVHPDSYDTWREREAFITGISVGAPPDTVFTRGQNWGFPPLHPKNIREQGYRYFIASLRHHLKHADIIRIDHVMGLHRIFCIPEGLESSQGVYLRYRADELYAILALESQRNKAVIVGEDLGTVPRYVRPAMKQHGINRMYVLHYEMAADSEKEPLPVPPDSVASLNTHDMPPFIAFWQGLDITERRQLGLLDRENARKEKKARRNMVAALGNFLRRKGWLEETGTGIEAGSALRACLEFLTSSPASLVLVNLEDLWQETEPQNVPSTREEYPNWQRKAKYNFEEFCQLPTVLDTLRTINKLRNRKR